MATGIRVAVIVIQDNKVLTMYSNYDGEQFYVLPGGKLEHNETLEQCAVREMKEETDLDIEVGKLAYIRDFKDAKGMELDIFFHAKVIGGTLKHKEEGQGEILKIEWIPIDKLKDIDFLPKTVARMLPEDAKNNFKHCAKYLGKCD